MSLLRDVRDAIRSLRAQRGTTIVAVVILAICIGANTAVYSVLQRLVLRPFPGVARQDRLVAVGMWDGAKERCCGLSVPDLEDLQRRTRGAEGIAGARLIGVNVGTADRPAYAGGQLVTANFFDVIGVRPIHGRTFARGEDRAGAAPVAVISERLWRERFDASAAIVGRTRLFNGRPFTIVGIVPGEFRGLFLGYWIDVWIPVSASDRFFARGSRLDDRAETWLNGYARLREGATAAQLDAEVRTVARQLAREFPATNAQRHGAAFPLARSPYGATPLLTPVMAVVMAVVLVVLLIGCTNIAGLQVVRALARVRELAIRAALGASARRLFRALLVENLLLAVAGGLAGLAIAVSLSDVVTMFVPPRRVRVDLSGRIDGGVLLMNAMLTIVAGVISGVLPAMQAWKLDLAGALKEESAGASPGRARMRMREALVVAQIALGVVLCITAALFVQQTRALERLDPGFDRRALLFASYNFFTAGYEPAQTAVLLPQLVERLRDLPGVTAVSFTTRIPLSLGEPEYSEIRTDRYVRAPGETPRSAFTAVGPRYFATMGTRITAGRDFDDRDTKAAPLVCGINASLRERWFAGVDPVGRRLFVDGQWRTVVAVVADGKSQRLGDPPRPHAFVAALQGERHDGALIVRTAMPTASLSQPVRGAMRDVAPRLVPFFVTVDDHMRTAAFGERLGATLIGILGVFALLLSLIGVHAVIAANVAHRTRELAIRIVLGATIAGVRRLVVLRGARLAAIGLVLGIAGALACSYALREQLAAPFDAAAYALPIALIALAAVVASWVPARRADRVAPAEALR